MPRGRVGNVSMLYTRECNPGTRIPENPGKPAYFQDRKPGFLCGQKPGFSGFDENT